MKFDSNKHYLGKICKRGHEHENTGKSIRFVRNNTCCTCIRKRPRGIDSQAKDVIRKIKIRAGKTSTDILIDHNWILNNTPKVCPVLNIPLIKGDASRDRSPSVDRLKPELGYTPENCRIISNRANRIKNDATVQELRMIADWLEKELKMVDKD
jgi:hypothetical protein